ncbi:polyketide antibiotic transporter [Cryptosporangium sp. NPDC051539]|uniref:polyketide antibiotic transporter n=1 Tax=Cryptosporangium sp. NPDC051539 TaxID=3363962 RepID=UPI0037B1969C
MTAVLTSTPTPARPSAAGRAVSGLAFRQLRLGAGLVLVTAVGVISLVAATADAIISVPGNVGSLRSLAGNPAIRTLFGDPVGLDTIGGFAVWRVGTPLSVLVSVWAIVATTRVTRGDEAAGRWDLLLAGRTSLRAVVSRHLALVAAASVLIGLGVTVALTASGAGGGGALVFGAGLALVGACFASLAALAAQVFSGRAAATTSAVAVLGASLLLRMLGDGVDVLGRLRWLSPLGLLGLAQPYAANQWLPLVVLGLAAAALAAATAVASGRRDLARGLVPARPVRRARTGLLGSVDAFAFRRVFGPVVAWSLALGAYFLLIGLTAQSALDFLADNPMFGDRAADAGFALSSVRGFAATLFAVLALPIGGFVSVRLAAFTEAEADRRLTPLAAGPITRVRLIGAEIAATAVGAVALAVVAGLTLWLGLALSGGTEFGLGQALGGAINMLPIVALCLAASVLAVGWMPRAVGAVGGLPAVGGFLLYVLALDAGAPRWLLDFSPFAHLAAVPLDPPHWVAAGTMTLLAAAGVALGILRFRDRDLRG